MSAVDHALLVELDAAGMPDAADEFEREIRSQHDLPAERDHRSHEVTESELAASIDWITAERAAAASHGTGGGRRRRPDQAGPDA